jgi:ankyrin repeat protein
MSWLWGKSKQSPGDKLCAAARSGNVGDIEAAIATGADPNMNEGTIKETPLQLAAMHGHMAAMAALIKAGARVDGGTKSGMTSLMCASWKGHAAVVDALIAAGASVNRATVEGSTALHDAAWWGHPGIAHALLMAGADPTARNIEGERPIDVVSRRRDRRDGGAQGGVGGGGAYAACTMLHRVPQICLSGNNVSNTAALRALLQSPPAVSASGGAGAASTS